MTPQQGFAPFPEIQLTWFAKTHGNSWPELSKACRDAVDCYAALRDRCLTAELERDQCEHAVRTHLDPDLWPVLLGEQTAD